MAEIAKIHTDKLKDLKERVEEAREYFKANVERYEKFMKFVFKSSLKEDEVATLAATGKPTIEFNIVESFVSRLRGEFAKQQPSLEVRAADGVPLSMLDRTFSETLDLIEAHLRAVFLDAANDMLDYNAYSDSLGGGWSVARVFTEYVNEKSFEQNIMVERVFDPTLTFFDPLARKSHKGDGRFCGELYPMPRSVFEEEYGKTATDSMKFTRNVGGFDWSYQNEKEEIVLICEYYEKKKKKEKIAKYTDGISRTKKEYEKFLEDWVQSGRIEQPPIADGTHERMTQIEQIVRYRFCESEMIDYIETDYKYLPLVFIDGNSVILKEGGSYEQMTRPYVYHAEGGQRLKNFAGQSLANELENTVQHKWIVPIESIPEDYLESYQNPQKPDSLIYNHFHEGNPQIVLPPPQAVMRTPIPPEITNTFTSADQIIERTLGNFEQNQGVSSAPLSGIAFARSAIQSNGSSVPYLVGYIKALNRIAQIVVDLIPKYYRTPRSLPILLPDGKRSYTMINKKDSLYMNFDPNSLQVKVETGVNFAMQKEIALQTIIAMSQANQGFAAFFNEEGLPVLLDNIDIRGIDQLKEKANGWMQKQKQLQAQQMQVAQQQQQQQTQQMQMQMQQQQMQMAGMKKELQSPSQTQIEQMYIQQKSQTDAANVAIKAQDSETKRLEVLNKIQNADITNELKAAEIINTQERTAVEAAISIGSHINETIALHKEPKEK